MADQIEEIARELAKFDNRDYDRLPEKSLNLFGGIGSKRTYLRRARQIRELIPQGDDEGLLKLPEAAEYLEQKNVHYGLGWTKTFGWDVKGLLKAQQALTRQENETKAQLDRLDADQKGYNAGLKRGKQEIPEAKRQERERIFKELERLGVLVHHIGAFDSGYIDSNNYYTLIIDHKWYEDLEGGGNYEA